MFPGSFAAAVAGPPRRGHGPRRSRSSPTASSTRRRTASPTCCASAGLQPGDHVAAVPRELRPLPPGHLGMPLRRPLLHRDELPAHHRGDGVHPRRLRSAGLHHVGLQGRAGGRAARPDAGRRRCGSCSTAPSTATSPTRTPSPAQPATPLDEERVEGQDMLYSSGTTGRPKGVKVPLPDAPLGEGADGVTGLAQLLFSADESSVYLSPAPLYHAAPLRFCRATHRLGGTVDRDGALRPGAVPRARGAAPRHLQPGRADDVHPDAQAPGGGARALRPVVAPGRGARRRAVPGRGEGADHRLVRPDHPRVLRRHRGQRLRVLQQRRLARPPRHGGQVDPRHGPHRRRGRRGAAHRRVRHRVLRGRDRVDVRVPQRRREDRQLARPEGPRLEHPRRRRLPRRGRLPLPHRSQGLHDHHGRRERVPAGGRERPRPPPEGERRRGVRRAQRRLRRRGEGRRRAGVDGRRPAPTSSASSSRTARSTSPT